MSTPTTHSYFQKTVGAQVDSAASLEWRARNLARGLHLGKHLSSKIGVGMEFNQFRNYVQGDDIRLLDWKMYAKTQQYFIRQSDIETNHSLQISIDNSKSMDYTENEISKLSLAKTLTATLTYVMAQQSDQFGWHSGAEVFAKSQGLKNWRRSVIALDELKSQEESNRSTLDKASRTSTGIHLWMTDLYMELSDIEGYINAHIHPQSELVIFHLIGRKEESLDFDSNTKFIDLETGDEMQVNANKFRKTYQESIGEHFHQVRRLCQNKGIVYRKVYLQADVQNELRAFLADYNTLQF